MLYRHAPAADHGDLDAVLVSAPGRPTLPVRLTLELFGRALAFAGDGPVTVWDPCCGAGTTLAVLGLRRGADLTGLVGTDVDPSPLELARRNLALLDPGGLDARASDLDALAERYGKPGYTAAAAAARRIVAPAVPYEVGVADVTDPAATASLVERHRPRVVIADLPHGVQTQWAGSGSRSASGSGTGSSSGRGLDSDFGTGTGRGSGRGSGRDSSSGSGSGPGSGAGRGSGSDDAATELLSALAAVLAPDAVIAVAGRGRKLALPPGSRALERLRVGHRAAVLVRAGDVPAAS